MLRAALGELTLLAVAWLLSEDRRHIPWRTVMSGVVLQILLALLLLKFPPAVSVVLLVNHAARAVQNAGEAGTSFVFGYLGGGPLPFTELHSGASFVLAFQALPLVLVVSALAALLFHWGVMQWITGACAWLLRRWMGIGGALAVGAVVHIFVGMVEAPLLIRPYLVRMSRGELFALMSCGMAGVAGTVMVIYAAFLTPLIPNALGNILIASVISTPAALAVSALMVPFRGVGAEEGRLVIANPPASSIDALVKGTEDGIPVLISIIAVLVVTISVVALVNVAFGQMPYWGGAPLTLQLIFAVPSTLVMWVIGVPWNEAADAALLMGTKTVLNEFVAYVNFAKLPMEAFDPRTRIILSYALCGFANFGSAGIMIGGIGTMIPDRRAEVAQLGLRSIISGTLATCMSGAVAGAFAA
jgi:concentrative nucleoside transporter, CNT family